MSGWEVRHEESKQPLSQSLYQSGWVAEVKITLTVSTPLPPSQENFQNDFQGVDSVVVSYTTEPSRKGKIISYVGPPGTALI